MSQVLYMLLGGIDFLKFSWLLLYLGIVKSLTTATEKSCIQIEITVLFLQYLGVYQEGNHTPSTKPILPERVTLPSGNEIPNR